jgi:uncharacterized protein YndB with AHSA1/START domain
MTTITRTFHLTLPVPPETAFAYVSDLTRHGEWNRGLKIEKLTAGPVGVGSQYRTVGEVPGQKERPNQLRVTRYEPPRHFSFVAQDPDFQDVTHDFTCSPQVGGTQLERTLTLQLPPLVALAFRMVIFPFIGKPGMEKSLAALKAKLEQGHA